VRPIRVYELLGRTADEVQRRIPGLVEQLPTFREALKAFEKRQWDEARTLFEVVLTQCGDGVSRHYIERCTHYIANPPALDWDGVWRLPEK
jgi:adenylate cyclase